MEPITSFSGKYDFLSNFYPCLIEHSKIRYPSVEHAFQASKTTDRQKRKEISRLPTPGMAKRAGRKLKIRPGWDEIKLEVMEDLLVKKFRHPELKKKLIGTGTAYLIEGNHWGDEFWGCTPTKDDPVIWRGENHLGLLLMEIRAGLIDFNG